MKIAYICICSLEYINYYRELYKSLKKHNPQASQILYFIGDLGELNWDEFDTIVNFNDDYKNCDESYNRLERICSLRARAVLNAFDQGYEKVVFCGAKIKFFDKPCLLETLLNDHSAVVTPHITQPLPEDGKFPSNASVSFTGHISTDLVGFKKCPEIIKFLTWQDEIMKNQVKTTNNTYLDQSWLNFLPFFVENVKILHHPGYNRAYWNWNQTNWVKQSSKWVMADDSHWVFKTLVCFQFSGLDLENPVTISKHQNRYKAEGDFLEFLKDYVEKVK